MSPIIRNNFFLTPWMVCYEGTGNRKSEQALSKPKPPGQSSTLRR